MMKNVRSALAGVDLIVYLVDGSEATDEEEVEYINKLKSEDHKVLTVLTKNDQKRKSDDAARDGHDFPECGIV